MKWIKHNHYSHLTAKNRDRASYPLRWLLRKHKIEGTVLDYGCGFGVDVEFLQKQGYQASGYDPAYFPEKPTGLFDTIICTYVLNVLFPIEQAKVLMNIASLLKPTGTAYFTVRRDLTFEGFRTHKMHKKPTFQCNVTLPYQSLLRNDFCEIYAYQPYHAMSVENDCVFCAPNKDRPIITESATAYAIFDKYPVSKGHALIIPKRHISNYFDLTEKEQQACWLVVNHVKKLLAGKYGAQDFNIGINIGEVAGQTIPHAHIHLIPRYAGDVSKPEGGVRHVIPEKGYYIKE